MIACGSNNTEQITEEALVEISAEENKEDLLAINNEERVETILNEEETETTKEAQTTELKVGNIETAIEEKAKQDINDVKEDVLEPIKEEEVEQKEKPVEVIRPNHTAWNELTKKHVTGAGNVYYTGMRANSSKIETYLEHLKNTPPKSDWTKNEKLAYWLNLYNASTVYLIVSNYPIKSITKINGGKPWDKKFIKSGDKIYSLNDIENKIIRPRFKDPRIHAALNCAAKSCPEMMSGAYLPKKLSTQLTKQVKAWINDGFRNKITADKIEISQIFDWYKVDFKDGVIAFINKYGSVKVNENAKISYLEYDWALNE